MLATLADIEAANHGWFEPRAEATQRLQAALAPPPKAAAAGGAGASSGAGAARGGGDGFVTVGNRGGGSKAAGKGAKPASNNPWALLSD